MHWPRMDISQRVDVCVYASCLYEPMDWPSVCIWFDCCCFTSRHFPGLKWWWWWNWEVELACANTVNDEYIYTIPFGLSNSWFSLTPFSASLAIHAFSLHSIPIIIHSTKRKFQQKKANEQHSHKRVYQPGSPSIQLHYVCCLALFSLLSAASSFPLKIGRDFFFTHNETFKIKRYTHIFSANIVVPIHYNSLNVSYGISCCERN